MPTDWKQIWGSEWEYVKRLGSAISDPEQKKDFWENIKSLKEADPKFSIYSLFPRSDTPTDRARNECVDFVRSLIRAPEKKEPEQE